MDQTAAIMNQLKMKRKSNQNKNTEADFKQNFKYMPTNSHFFPHKYLLLHKIGVDSTIFIC